MPTDSGDSKRLSGVITARLYDRLSRLHLEMANAYAELAASMAAVKAAGKTVAIKSKSGKMLASLCFRDDRVQVQVIGHLPTDNAPYAWLKNHLRSMTGRDETLRLEFGEQDHMLEFVEMEGKVTLQLAKELESATRWAFIRMNSSRTTASNEPHAFAQNTRQAESFSNSEEGRKNG